MLRKDSQKIAQRQVPAAYNLIHGDALDSELVFGLRDLSHELRIRFWAIPKRPQPPSQRPQ